MDFYDEADMAAFNDEEELSEDIENESNESDKDDKENNVSKKGKKSKKKGDNDVDDDGKIKIKRVPKNPRPKLDADRLCGERGLIALKEMFEKVKFKGEGHEFADLDLLVTKFKYWADRLMPSMAFEDVIDTVEKLGAKNQVKQHLQTLLYPEPEEEDAIINKDDNKNERNKDEESDEEEEEEEEDDGDEDGGDDNDDDDENDDFHQLFRKAKIARIEDKDEINDDNNESNDNNKSKNYHVKEKENNNDEKEKTEKSKSDDIENDEEDEEIISNKIKARSKAKFKLYDSETEDN